MKRPKLWQSPSLHNRFVRNIRSRLPLMFNFFECKKNDSEMCGECGTFDVIVALESCDLWVSSCSSVSINKRNCCVNQPYHMEITVSFSTSPTSVQCNSFICSVCVCDTCQSLLQRSGAKWTTLLRRVLALRVLENVKRSCRKSPSRTVPLVTAGSVGLPIFCVHSPHSTSPGDCAVWALGTS